MPLVGDGVADDTAAIQALIDAAGGGWVELPAGTFRTTADLTRRANASVVPGLKLRGKHPLATTIYADYNGNASTGAIVRLDTTAISQYTQFSKIEDLTIKQAPARTGLNGIQLTAAWWVDIRNVKIEGLSGHGIITTLRPDIHPTISDYYQSFSVTMQNLYIRQCGGWGIKFGAGQSPGLFILEHSMIWGNTAGGVVSTTGQCRIVGNAIAENGSIGAGGGLLFDTAEGPSMVADVRQNEIDCNWNYNIWLRRSRGLIARQNRLLHCSVADPASWTRTSGGAYMRPPVGVLFGDGASEVYRALFEQNMHRSVTGPSATTAPVSHYKRNANADVKQCRIWYNDLDYPDGLIQNSAGSIKFDGFAGTDTNIIDGSAGVSLPPPVSEGTLVFKARATSAQDVYGSITAIAFAAKDLDPDAQGVGQYYFKPKVTGDYNVRGNYRIKNLSAGQNVILQGWYPGNNTMAFTKTIAATGTAGENLSFNQTFNMKANVAMAFTITVPWPSKPLDIGDGTTNWIEVRKL